MKKLWPIRLVLLLLTGCAQKNRAEDQFENLIGDIALNVCSISGCGSVVTENRKSAAKGLLRWRLFVSVYTVVSKMHHRIRFPVYAFPSFSESGATCSFERRKDF